jgi:hypothetical protein
MKFRWVRLATFAPAAAWSAWWWDRADHTPGAVSGMLAITIATLHGYHAALLAGPVALLILIPWWLWPLAFPSQRPA